MNEDIFRHMGPAHLLAEVTFKSTESGGRQTAASSNYRPHHLVKDDYLTSGFHQYLDKESVNPGETATANI